MSTGSDGELDLAVESEDDSELGNVEAKVKEVEAPEERSDLSIAADEVIKIINNNVFDNDLEQSLVLAVQKYFDELKARPHQGPDAYNIPVLNQRIWDAFHDYEEFVHKSRFENIDLVELGRIVRNYVTPKVTEFLWDRNIERAKQS